MWSWPAKAAQIAGADISNSTSLRSIGMATIAWPIPLFAFPRAYSRFLSLPLLGCVADGYDDWLAANGYTSVSRQNSIRILPHVDAELRRRQVKELANPAQPVLRNCWRTLRKNRPFSAKAVRALERYLAANGLIADDQPATATSTASEFADEYTNYLREVRGFAASTVANHRYTVQCFLQRLDGAEIPLKKIRVPQIESYIIQASKRLSRSSLQHDIGALRSFLRFQAIKDRVPSGLDSQIDTPRLYQLETLPRALPWETVRTLLRSIDRTSAMGLRDYAMFWQIATCELRVSEVMAITLDDIRWRQCSLRIRQSKAASSPLELPLTNQVSTALVKHLKRTPPPAPYRRIFLRMRAPIGVLTRTVIRGVLSRLVRNSGVRIPFQGAHCLRGAHQYGVTESKIGPSLRAAETVDLTSKWNRN
jgi:integrase/recombinase XerD